MAENKKSKISNFLSKLSAVAVRKKPSVKRAAGKSEAKNPAAKPAVKKKVPAKRKASSAKKALPSKPAVGKKMPSMKRKPAGKSVVKKKIAISPATANGKKAAKVVRIKKTAPKKEEAAVRKPRVAIASLTSCEGCQFALLDLGEKFLDFVGKIEMVDFRLIEDEEDGGGELDLVLVEGNPVTEENVKTLEALRKRSKLLVALGNCAAMGGIPEIKNYQEGANTIKHVYKYIHGINNPEIKEIDNFVKVDFVFPGCPISGEEFLRYIPELLAGRIPVIPDQPVCIECKAAGNRCLLLDKKPCFGPMIQGGCGAVCPTSRMTCQGCRGLRPTGNVKAMRAALKNMVSDHEFENIAEIFGLRDDIEAREKS